MGGRRERGEKAREHHARMHETTTPSWNTNSVTWMPSSTRCCTARCATTPRRSSSRSTRRAAGRSSWWGPTAARSSKNAWRLFERSFGSRSWRAHANSIIMLRSLVPGLALGDGGLFATDGHLRDLARALATARLLVGALAGPLAARRVGNQRTPCSEGSREGGPVRRVP